MALHLTESVSLVTQGRRIILLTLFKNKLRMQKLMQKKPLVFCQILLHALNEDSAMLVFVFVYCCAQKDFSGMQ